MGRSETLQKPPFVVVDANVPRGRIQKEDYLQKHLEPLLDGRLAVPRKNMRLDNAVELVAERCIKCGRDLNERLCIATEILEQSPYPTGKTKALRHIDHELAERSKMSFDEKAETSLVFQKVTSKLIDLSGRLGDKKIRAKAFDLSAIMGRDLVRDKGQRLNYFPELFESLANEADEECTISKFVSIYKYLNYFSDTPDREQMVDRVLDEAKNRLAKLDPKGAVDFIFTFFSDYESDCLSGITFQRPPFDLPTLQNICLSVPVEQRGEITELVYRQLISLMDYQSSFTGFRPATYEVRRALVKFFVKKTIEI